MLYVADECAQALFASNLSYYYTLIKNYQAIDYHLYTHKNTRWPKKSTSSSKVREHNLKNIGVEIPRNKLVVVTGLSGSGKSSLAFDTIYA